MATRNMTNNDPQNTTQKTYDPTTRTAQANGGDPEG